MSTYDEYDETAPCGCGICNEEERAMANAVNSIEVTVDTEKLAADVAKAIQEQVTNFTRDLRYVADILDKGDFWKHLNEEREEVRKEAFEAGKASRD